MLGRWMVVVLTVLSLGVARAAEAPSPPEGMPAMPSMQDPAVLQNAMKMLQNPQMMEQMKVMMQDPAVKERMKRMLQRLGPDSTILGAEGVSAGDDEAMDKIWERMQAALADPAVLEKLAAAASSEKFQSRMQQLAADPTFSKAANSYVEEMKQEIEAELSEMGVDGDDAQLGLDDENAGVDGEECADDEL